MSSSRVLVQKISFRHRIYNIYIYIYISTSKCVAVKFLLYSTQKKYPSVLRAIKKSNICLKILLTHFLPITHRTRGINLNICNPSIWTLQFQNRYSLMISFESKTTKRLIEWKTVIGFSFFSY